MRRFLPHLGWLSTLLIPFWVYGNFFWSDALFNEIAPLHFEFAEKSWFFNELREGRLSFLYPFSELGHSILANPASGILYLGNLLHVVLPYHLAYKILFLIHQLILFFGLRHLLRQFHTGLRVDALALLGCSLGIVSSLPVHVAFWYVSFFPWAISFTMDLWQKRGGILKTSLVFALMFLLGDPFLLPTALIIGTIIGFRRESLKVFSISFLKVIGIVTSIIAPHLLMMLGEAPYTSRALGLDPAEALSYSTAPIRILDWLFPAFEPYELSRYMTKGLQLQWWFPEIGGGIALTLFLMLGFWSMQKTLRIKLGLMIGFFVFLALGEYFTPSAWIQTHLPVLKVIRFPERYLAYAFPLIMLGSSFALSHLNRVWLMGLLSLGLLENLALPRRMDLISSASLQTELPRQIWVGNELHETRYLLCEYGLTGTESYRYSDTRAFGLQLVNGTSNTRSPGLKVFNCPLVLKPHVQQWLGLTHVIAGEGLHTQSGSPWKGMWVEKWQMGPIIEGWPLQPADISRIKLASEGTFFVDENTHVSAPQCLSANPTLIPSLDRQSFEIKNLSSCFGLLSVPLAFHRGWKVEPNVNLIRLNQSTLGLEIKPEVAQLKLSFDPTGMRALVVFSFLMQALILATMVVRFLLTRK